jgi:hypothetical protein
MCKFFSFLSDGRGSYYYCDWETRKKITSGELKTYGTDSHTSIAHLSGFSAEQEDGLNKYEYNPFTKEFTIDQINTKDDSKDAEGWVRSLDFSLVCPLVTFKEMINPLSIAPNTVEKGDIDNLKKWASIRASIVRSGTSIRADWVSIWASVVPSIGSLIWASIRGSIRVSVWVPVRDSIGDSIGTSIGDSVWDSVRAYITSFFNIDLGNFDCLLKLYDRGFVPSYDGTTWRLHSGTKAQAVYECTIH